MTAMPPRALRTKTGAGRGAGAGAGDHLAGVKDRSRTPSPKKWPRASSKGISQSSLKERDDKALEMSRCCLTVRSSCRKSSTHTPARLDSDCSQPDTSLTTLAESLQEAQSSGARGRRNSDDSATAPSRRPRPRNVTGVRVEIVCFTLRCLRLWGAQCAWLVHPHPYQPEPPHLTALFFQIIQARSPYLKAEPRRPRCPYQPRDQFPTRTFWTLSFSWGQPHSDSCSCA